MSELATSSISVVKSIFGMIHSSIHSDILWLQIKPDMKKETIEPKPLTESEREKLIRLRVEIEVMKAEIEVVKKGSPWGKNAGLHNSRRKSSNHQRAQKRKIPIKVPT